MLKIVNVISFLLFSYHLNANGFGGALLVQGAVLQKVEVKFKTDKSFKVVTNSDIALIVEKHKQASHTRLVVSAP